VWHLFLVVRFVREASYGGAADCFLFERKLMSLAAEPNDTDLERDPGAVSVGSRRYSILDLLSQGRRADLLIGVAEGSSSLEELVVIKRFRSEVVTTDWVWLVPELEVARLLSHRNVVRTLDASFEPGRCVMINEYVEGASLVACLDGAAGARAQLPNAAVAHILLAILDAVKHARRAAQSPLSRLLVHTPIAAEDVFITYDGQVKLLGFKSAQRRSQDDASRKRPLAVELLLEKQRNAELDASLRGLPAEARAFESDPGDRLRQALQRVRGEGPGGDGRAPLARLMRHVLRQDHARRALRLVGAFSKLQRSSTQVTRRSELEDAPPSSGLRNVGARDTQS
jgi:hypothetical protein